MRDAFHRAFYWTVCGALRLVLSLGAQVRVHHFAKWPDGAFILASNHISHFDPPLISSWSPRKIDWLAMAELFSTGWSRRAFTALDAIPVDRGGEDRGALKECLRRMKRGHIVGVFPEGGIRDGARSILCGAQAKDGALLLAMHSACPIVPTVILGSDCLYNKRRWVSWNRARVFIATGETIAPPLQPSRHAREIFRAEFQAAIIQLKERTIHHFALGDDDLPKSPQVRMQER